MKDYELIEHTADIGIRVKARDLKELFINTARAMFDIMAQSKSSIRRKASGVKEVVIKQRADDSEELFVNWLNELLSLSATKELFFFDFKIKKLEKNNLEAVAMGEDIGDYKINTEIKAATYHQLNLEETKSGWQAEVIFDV